jgi:hypothetical protein
MSTRVPSKRYRGPIVRVGSSSHLVPPDELLLHRGATDARVLTEQYVDVVEREAADMCLVKLVQRLAARLARGDPEAPEVAGQVEPVDLSGISCHAANRRMVTAAVPPPFPAILACAG